MKAGRELDALVAEKVMGCKVERVEAPTDGVPYDTCGCRDGAHAVESGWIFVHKPYSTDIAAAWEVVEKFRRTNNHDFGDLFLAWGNYGADTTPKRPHGQMVYPDALAWLCKIERNEYVWSAYADTAPHAICLAALKAVSESSKPETEGERG